MLTCLVVRSALGFTALGEQQQINEPTFDASICKSLSGSVEETKWCVSHCGSDTSPYCPESFCKCGVAVPSPPLPSLPPPSLPPLEVDEGDTEVAVDTVTSEKETCSKPSSTWCTHDGEVYQFKECGGFPGHFCHDAHGNSGFHPCDEKRKPTWGAVECQDTKSFESFICGGVACGQWTLKAENLDCFEGPGPGRVHMSGTSLERCMRDCLNNDGCQGINVQLSTPGSEDVACWLWDDVELESCRNGSNDFKLFTVERFLLPAVEPQVKHSREKCTSRMFLKPDEWWRAVSERRATVKEAKLPSQEETKRPVGSSHELVGSLRMTYHHVILNPTIMMLPGNEDVLVMARRMYFGTSGTVLPGALEPAKLWQSSLVKAVVPLKRLLEASQRNAGESISTDFTLVQVDGDSCSGTIRYFNHCDERGVYPCLPDPNDYSCGEPAVTQMAVGPEDPRFFTCCGGKTFLLDFRSPASRNDSVACSEFCGRMQPWLTPIDEEALRGGHVKLGKSQQLSLDGRSCDRWASEKNWAPVGYRDHLYMSRSFFPQHELVEIHEPPELNQHEKKQDVAIEKHLTTPSQGIGDVLDMRGGSPWVEIDLPERGRRLVSIGHTKRAAGGEAYEYRNMVMLADAEPPFTITSVGPPLPLECLPRSNGPPGDKICFATGLVILHSHVLVSYGSADEMAKIWVIGRDEFVQHFIEPADDRVANVDKRLVSVPLAQQQPSWGKTLFYQYHIPKAAGTAVALTALQAICGDDVAELLLDLRKAPEPDGSFMAHAAARGKTAVSADDNAQLLANVNASNGMVFDYSRRCTMECRSGRLVDLEFSCVEPKRERKEHLIWDEAELRVRSILDTHAYADRAIAFTCVRDPVPRVVSHWLHCVNEWMRYGNTSGGKGKCTHGAHGPPAGVKYLSNESFRHFLESNRDGPKDGLDDTESKNFFRTANLQVGMLASVPRGVAVQRKHLEQVKNMLSRTSGGSNRPGITWYVDTSDNLTGLLQRIAAQAGMPHSDETASRWLTVANTEHLEIDAGSLQLESTPLAAEMNTLDAELYKWVSTELGSRPAALFPDTGTVKQEASGAAPVFAATDTPKTESSGAGEPPPCEHWTGLPRNEHTAPLQCGAVFFLHIGKTGGTTVSKFLMNSAPEERRHLPGPELLGQPTRRTARFVVKKDTKLTSTQKDQGSCQTCRHHFFKLFRSDMAQVGNNGQPPPIEQWGVFQELNKYLNTSKPLAAIEIHHGVPGIGEELWNKYLVPWKQMLESQGCGFRLVTVLRNPRDRLESDWDYCNDQGYINGPNGNAMTFCQFAAENSNSHIKYVLRGSKWLWKPEWRQFNVTEDLQLLKDAQEVMQHFDLVGRTEELDGFMGQLQQMLGITGVSTRDIPISNAVPKERKSDWSQASEMKLRCLSDGTSVDEMLYNSYCAKSS